MFVCVYVRKVAILNSPFIINADIFKCLLSGSTRLISSSLAYAIIENTHKSVQRRIHSKPRLRAYIHTDAKRHLAAHLNPK